MRALCGLLIRNFSRLSPLSSGSKDTLLVAVNPLYCQSQHRQVEPFTIKFFLTPRNVWAFSLE